MLHENFVNGFKNLFFVLFSVVKKAVKMQFTFSDIQHKNGISVSPAVESIDTTSTDLESTVIQLKASMRVINNFHPSIKNTDQQMTPK